MVYMSKQEIIHRYRNMDTARNRIAILAELNDCTTREIERIINQKPEKPMFVRPPKPKRTAKQIMEDRMWQMYQYKCPDKYIARVLGTCATNIYRWRLANGLPSNTNHRPNRNQIAVWDSLFA